MSNFKFNAKDNKVWDPTKLKDVLDKQYGGAKSVKEAIEYAIRNKDTETKKESTISQPEVFNSDPQDELNQRFRLAVSRIAEENDESLEFYGQLATNKAWLDEQPLNTVENIDLWERGWLKLIRLAKKTYNP